MKRDTYTKSQLWAELAALGEDQVRERMATSVYGDVGTKRALVELWLQHQRERREKIRHTIADTAAIVTAIATAATAIATFTLLASK